MKLFDALNLDWEAMIQLYNTFFKIIAPGLILFTVLGNQAFAQAQEGHSYALFLYNFGKFSNSNAEADQFIFTILGDERVTNSLRKISKNKKIEGKPVHVKQCNTLEQIGTPQILFVPASESGLLPEILDRTKGKSIKIITEKSAGILSKQNPGNGAEATCI